jgi:multicomponent Na+:H+ antiporter subunit F
MMFNMIMWISVTFISLAMIGLIFRVIKGPTVADRVVALDAIGISLVSLVALVSILLETSAFLDIILLIGILAFIGTVAFSKYLEKGVIMEYDRNGNS